MKKILFACSLFVVSTVAAQKSEELIPSEAITVFSLNNIQLLQKISMDQLVQYDFMEELQQELFDGSTNNKTIKDSGLDFDQKINIFLGKNPIIPFLGYLLAFQTQPICLLFLMIFPP